MSGSFSSICSGGRWVRSRWRKSWPGPDPRPGPDLGEHGPAHHVPRGQVLDGGGVALHEPLALGVAQDAALAPGRLRQEDAELVDARGVELEELHVLQGHAPAEEEAGAVAGEGVGVGGDLEHPAEAAGGEQGGPAGEDVEVAGGLLVGDHAGHAPLGVVADEGHVEDLELVEEDHAPGHALLVEGLEDHVAGAVGGEAGPAHGGLAVVAGVAAEAALVDQALLGAVEGQAEVLQLDDGVDRLPAHDLGRGLVDQVVTALDRVEGVPLPRVLLHVGQGRAHPPLGGAGVGPGGIELGEHRRAALPDGLDGRPQPGPARPDDHRVEAVPSDLHLPMFPPAGGAPFYRAGAGRAPVHQHLIPAGPTPPPLS